MLTQYRTEKSRIHYIKKYKFLVIEFFHVITSPNLGIRPRPSLPTIAHLSHALY